MVFPKFMYILDVTHWEKRRFSTKYESNANKIKTFHFFLLIFSMMSGFSSRLQHLKIHFNHFFSFFDFKVFRRMHSYFRLSHHHSINIILWFNISPLIFPIRYIITFAISILLSFLSTNNVFESFVGSAKQHAYYCTLHRICRSYEFNKLYYLTCRQKTI